MTTLYFESGDEDDFRKIGFSKDGKFQNPQIMLGLLVGEYGYPIGYELFEGNTFEGHTLIPVLEKFQKKFLPPRKSSSLFSLGASCPKKISVVFPPPLCLLVGPGGWAAGVKH